MPHQFPFIQGSIVTDLRKTLRVWVRESPSAWIGLISFTYPSDRVSNHILSNSSPSTAGRSPLFYSSVFLFFSPPSSSTMFLYSFYPPILLSFCPPLILSSVFVPFCPIVLLSSCQSILLCFCPPLLLCVCPLTLLSFCPTVLLFFCPLLSLSSCPPVFLSFFPLYLS